MGKRKRVQLVQIEVDGEMVAAKECTKCGVVKVLNGFGKKKGGLGDRHSQCRECRKGFFKKRYETDKDYHLNYAKERYERNRKRHLELCLMWRKRNPDYNTTYMRNWRKENPEKRREYEQRRRARKAGLPDDMSDRRWEEIVAEDFNGVCALTEETDGLHLEHFIPVAISHGGTYVGNVYPLIEELNLSKNNANPFEWIKRPDISERVPADRWNALVLYLAEKNGLTVEEFREFVYWCFDNPRTPAQAAKDTKRGITSLDLWRDSKLRKAANE